MNVNFDKNNLKYRSLTVNNGQNQNYLDKR